MDRRNYLEIVSEQIRCKKALPLVTNELESHIEDQKTDYMAEGMTAREAEEAAVREMGDPVEVGVQMDGIHKPKMPWKMIALIVFISMIGYGIQCQMDAFLQGVSISEVPLENILIQKSFLYYIVGIAVMIGICFLDYTWIARYAEKLSMAMFFGTALGMLWRGNMVNGSLTVIVISGINITVSLLVYLFVPLYCAVLYKYRGEGYDAIVKAVLWMVPPLLVVEFVPSTLTSITLLLSFLVILFAAVYKNWFKVSKKIVLGGIGTFIFVYPAVVCAFVWMYGYEYQKMRLQVLLDPASTDAGYQILMLRKLIDGSKFIGQNNTFNKEFMALPVNHDYVLTYVTSYYGILAAVAGMALLVFMIFRLMKISLKQKNQLGMLMGVGCSAVFIFQIIFYILNNIGIFSFGGSYCPLLNRGGTGTVVTYTLLGLILSICRYQNVLPEQIDIKKKHVEKSA